MLLIFLILPLIYSYYPHFISCVSLYAFKQIYTKVATPTAIRTIGGNHSIQVTPIPPAPIPNVFSVSNSSFVNWWGFHAGILSLVISQTGSILSTYCPSLSYSSIMPSFLWTKYTLSLLLNSISSIFSKLFFISFYGCYVKVYSLSKQLGLSLSWFNNN